MDARILQQLYMELLYSSDPDELPPSIEATYLLKTLDVKKLKVERSARIRNLRTVLHTDMQVLNRYLSKNELLSYVENYCISHDIWKHKGRTLIEDFCIFISNDDQLVQQFKILARIEGVISGLSLSTNMASPWSDHIHKVKGGAVTESFYSSFSFSPSRLDKETSVEGLKFRDANSILKIICKGTELRITLNEVKI